MNGRTLGLVALGSLAALVFLGCESSRSNRADPGAGQTTQATAKFPGQNGRVIILMLDGLGIQYLDSTDLPTFARLRREGIFRRVQALMPTVTNTNNASIATGFYADRHGITGNSHLDASGSEAYMETADLLLAPTLFERMARSGVRSALLSAKKKTIGLLARGAEIAMSPQLVTPEWIDRLGTPPDVYSSEVNAWLMEATLWILENRRDIALLYVHTTDYPMHAWPPSAPESKAHLRMLDDSIARLIEAAPDAAILITADHDVNHKSRVWDLARAASNRGIPLRVAISAEKDKYPKHHRGFGGVSYVYLRAPSDRPDVERMLRGLEGVKDVLTREDAADRFHLMPERIGDLVVLGDATTVFGELPGEERETLPASYRTHGSEFERDIPLFVFRAVGAPSAESFRENKDLTTWLVPIDPRDGIALAPGGAE